MKSNLKRYALIGATGIGGYHLAAIQKLVREGSVFLAAVADPALSRQPALQSELQLQGIHPYLDYREMLQREKDLDVVVISAPIPFHLEMTLACLRCETFIYLEKPPVPLIQQLDTVLAADKHGRVGVGFQMINTGWMQTIKQAIVEGKLGRLKHIRIGACWPRLDGYYGRNSSAGKMVVRGEPVFDGPATNALAHLIHNAMYLGSNEADSFAVPIDVRGELYRARPIESYDVACLRARFRSGAILTAALTHATEETLPYGMEVRGTDGWAVVSNDGATFESSFSSSSEIHQTFEQLVDTNHRQFLDFACGKRSRFSTALHDTRGYVLTTNGMLMSSGGIHSIDEAHLRQYQRGEETGYEVKGLREAVYQSYQTGKLFSELGLPWAVRTSSFAVENLKTISLTQADPADCVAVF